LCYRERALAEHPPGFRIDHLCIFLDHDLAPGGYLWYFPWGIRGNRLLVNVGLGVTGAVPDAARSLRGRLQAFKARNPHFFRAYQILDDDPFNRCGALLPNRYALESLVDLHDHEPTGLIYAGDVAATADPLHGGGIKPAIESAQQLVRPVADFNNTSDYGALWQYCVDFARHVGSAKQAKRFVAGRVVQSATNPELNVVARVLLQNTDFAALVYSKKGSFEEARLAARFARLGLSGRAGTSALRKIVAGAWFGSKIVRHYRHYPTLPHGVGPWTAELHRLVADLDRQLDGTVP